MKTESASKTTPGVGSSEWLGGIKWHLHNLTAKPTLYLVYLRLQLRYPLLKLLKCGVECVYGSRNVACKAIIALLEFRNFFFYRLFFHIDPGLMPLNEKAEPRLPTTNVEKENNQ